MNDLPPPPSAAAKGRKSFWFYCRSVFAGAVLVSLLSVGGVMLYLSSSHFSNLARRKVIAALEDATGGRVEIRSFDWSLKHLSVEVDNLTIHGLEAAGEAPYAHVDRLYVRARILAFLQPKIALSYLEIDRPKFHLIVYPDGTTNQPTPHRREKSDKSIMDTVIDLQIACLEVNDGWALINQRAIPLNLIADNLSARMSYSPANDRYLGEVQIADLDLQRGSLRPFPNNLDLQFELGRNEADLKALHLVGGSSQLDASGSIANFAKPAWNLSTKGTVDLREVGTLVPVDGLNRGSVRLDLAAHGAGASRFSITGDTQLTNAVFETSYLKVEGVNATARLAIDPSEISISGIQTRLPDGGRVSADLRFTNWYASAPVAVKGPSPAARRSSPEPRFTAAIRAQVQGVRLPTVLQMVAIPRFQNLGFDTAADGAVNVDWTGDASDLTVGARMKLNAPPNVPPGALPLAGMVDAQYFERGGKVKINQLEAHTAASDLKASGVLAVYPVSASSTVDVNLETRSLAEFDRVLVDLGLSEHGKTGVAVIPVKLQGQAAFSGTVTGSLLDPDVKGHLTATNFSTTFDEGANSELAAAISGEALHDASHEVKGAAGSSSGVSTRTIHFDTLDAKAEYSSRLIEVEHATLTSGGAMVQVSGQLVAHRVGSRTDLFDENSALNVTARIHQAPVGDLLSIAGVSAPISGIAELQAHVTGSVGNLDGTGNLNLRGGEIAQEPYRSLDAALKFSGHTITLTKATLLQDGGKAVANGTYDLKRKVFLANLDAVDFELAHFHRIQAAGYPITGSLKFDAHASGTFESMSILLGVHLTNLTLRGREMGGLEAFAHTQGNTATFTARSTMTAARLELSGETLLRGDFPTRAKFTFDGWDVEPLLRAFNVQTPDGSTQFAGTINLSGPAKNPRQFSGDLEVSQFSAVVEGVNLQNQGPVHASYRNGILHVTQARITGTDTDMEISGSAGLLGERILDLAASGSINMTLAETLDSDLAASGHVDFNVEAAGTMQHPMLTGQVRLKKVAVSLNDVPTGISDLNGTLVFDQDRLEVQNLVGTVGGGQLKLAGFITYQQGVYGDLTATGKSVRVRYSGLSATADTTLHLQGSQANMLLSGNVLITRFIVGPNLDFAVFAGPTRVSQLPNPSAPSNHVRLDVHILSSPQLDFQNSYAQLAGSVDLRIRGTAAQPAVLGRISITEGTANFAGTNYQLQHGDIYFTNPVRIEPIIDIDATTRIEEYDVTVGLHGSSNHLTPTFRSEPPLPQADVISLLALGRTQQEQLLYSQEEDQAGISSATNALLGGALNATVSNRVQKLFGVGSVKIDPTYLGNLGNSTARITVQQNISRTVELTYATNVNTTAEQLIQAQVNLTSSISVLAVRDESDVFSMVLRVHKRLR